MKYSNATIVAALLTVLSIHAVPPLPTGGGVGIIPLIWDASPTPGVRYRLYHSTNDLTWHTNYVTTNVTFVLTNVPVGSSNWFTVRAFNSDGIESDPSNVYLKSIAPKPAAPGNLIAVPILFSLQSRGSNGVWQTVRTYSDTVIGSSAEPNRLFQVVGTIGQPTPLTPLPR